MATEDTPVLKVEWFDDPSWVDVTNYVKSFRVRNSGILKIQSADILLRNKAGKFTSGVDKIDPYSHIRVTANVRNSTWDDISIGRYFDPEGEWTRRVHGAGSEKRGAHILS